MGERWRVFGLSLIEGPPPPPRRDEAVSLSEIDPVLAGLLSGACCAAAEPAGHGRLVAGLGTRRGRYSQPAWLRGRMEVGVAHLQLLRPEAWRRHGQGLFRRRLLGATGRGSGIRKPSILRR